MVLAARAVPLADRISGALSAAVLAELCPALADVPLAGKPPGRPCAAPFDWRRQYGDPIASLLRDYTIDHGAVGGLFDVVNRSAAEKLLTLPHPDRPTVWALATLACLLSGDYRNARDATPALPVALHLYRPSTAPAAPSPDGVKHRPDPTSPRRNLAPARSSALRPSRHSPAPRPAPPPRRARRAPRPPPRAPRASCCYLPRQGADRR